jgi:hypothetical protein
MRIKFFGNMVLLAQLAISILLPFIRLSNLTNDVANLLKGLKE